MEEHFCCPAAKLAFWPHPFNVLINNLMEATEGKLMKNGYVIKLGENDYAKRQNQDSRKKKISSGREMEQINAQCTRVSCLTLQLQKSNYTRSG